jgi:hypothetical protein
MEVPTTSATFRPNVTNAILEKTLVILSGRRRCNYVKLPNFDTERNLSLEQRKFDLAAGQFP